MVAVDGDEPEVFSRDQAKVKHFRDQFDMEMGTIGRCVVADGVTAHTYTMHMTPKGRAPTGPSSSPSPSSTASRRSPAMTR
jgi:hypothetical protein